MPLRPPTPTPESPAMRLSARQISAIPVILMYLRPPITAGSPDDDGRSGFKLCSECGRLSYFIELETLCQLCRPGPLPPGVTRSAPDEPDSQDPAQGRLGPD